MKTMEKVGNTTYIIDKEEKTIKAIISNTRYDVINTVDRALRQSGIDTTNTVFSAELLLKQNYTGIAKCHEKDTFDLQKGKDIARKKAIIKYNKQKIKMLDELICTYATITSKLVDVSDYTQSKCIKLKNEINDN